MFQFLFKLRMMFSYKTPSVVFFILKEVFDHFRVLLYIKSYCQIRSFLFAYVLVCSFLKSSIQQISIFYNLFIFWILFRKIKNYFNRFQVLLLISEHNLKSIKINIVHSKLCTNHIGIWIVINQTNCSSTKKGKYVRLKNLL